MRFSALKSSFYIICTVSGDFSFHCQMEAAVHGHIVEECKRVIVEMCSGVFIRPVHGVFNSLFIQSINKAGNITTYNVGGLKA